MNRWKKLLGLCCFLGLLVCWCRVAEARRDVSLEVKRGYRHRAALTLFKRGLQLQGWKLTSHKSARWRIKLCPAPRVCMGSGQRLQAFKTPAKLLSPSTHARLLLLYFNMMRQRSGRSGPSGRCRCQDRRTRPARRIIRKPPKTKAPKPSPTKPQKESREPPASTPTKPRQTRSPLPMKPGKRPPTMKRVALDDDDSDFGEMIDNEALPRLVKKRRWRWWGALGASADLHWLDDAQTMPGGTLHLHMGWGSFGLYTALHFQAFFVDESRSIMLFRPTLALQWQFAKKPRLGAVRLVFGLQLGVTTEYGITPNPRAENGAYDHALQVGPLVGFHLHLRWRTGWSLFWRSDLAVTFRPGLDVAVIGPADLGIAWRNSVGAQYRFNFF